MSGRAQAAPARVAEAQAAQESKAQARVQAEQLSQVADQTTELLTGNALLAPKAAAASV